jgi:DNA adenine methylase
MTMNHPSPLRYPGGKTVLAPFLADVIRLNGLSGGIYIEPYAGGAGAALKLLFSQLVSKVYINDKDRRIYFFWKAVLDSTEAFLERVERTPLTVAQWRKQKRIFDGWQERDPLDVGFATFYLNRCNRSGVLNGGPIGGIDQTGNYKIDARFSRSGLQKRIETIALYRDNIIATNLDGVAFLKWVFNHKSIDPAKCLVYLDPPYFDKAHALYKVYFSDSDHRRLADYINKDHPFRWIVSYDDAALIKALYKGRWETCFMRYSAHTVRVGRELIIPSKSCIMPRGRKNVQTGFVIPRRSLSTHVA